MISEATDHYALTLPLPKRLTDIQLSGLPMPVYAALAGRGAMHDATAAQEKATATVGDLQISIWPDATHSLPMEYAAALDSAINTFLTAHEA